MRTRKEAGFTLVELLISVAIVGMIIGALYQVTSQVLQSYHTTGGQQELLPQARYALERMVMFVQESDQISSPDTGNTVEILTVSERASDQYNNANHAYAASGDQLLDADNDANGLVNNSVQDPPDFVTFDLDKTDATNWRLMEQLPDYGTSSTGDFKAKKIICEHIQAFSCSRLSPGLVKIVLTLQAGSAAVTLQTTAKARWIE